MRALVAGALVLAAGEAQAHAFAQRYDLPLPLWHYLLGAGAAVAVSFVIAALFLRGAGPEAPALRLAVPARLAAGARALLGALGAGAFLLLLAAGFLGAQEDWDSNLLPVSVWVIWWVGVAFLSAILGGVWPLIDPWYAIGRACAVRPAPFAWPRCLDAWPAVAIFAAFAFAELAWTENAVPGKLAGAITAYTALVFAGMALFGIDAWRANADPFARIFGLFSRFAPLALERGALVVRPFGAGLRQAALPSAASVAFVLLVLATVSFDGISETPFWQAAVGTVMRLLYDAGVVAALGYRASESLVRTLGLVATPLVFAAVYLAVCALVGRLAGLPAGVVARRYVFSLVPIAVAYHLAHYLSYLAIQGQAVWPLLSDPLSRGWDLFGTAAYRPDIGLVGMRTVWLFAVLAIVLGHIAAVALAHGEALRSAPTRRLAVTSQAPMLVLMIAYTMLSLWILSQPIVEA